MSVPCECTYVEPDNDAKIVESVWGGDVFVGGRFTRAMGAAADRLRLIALAALIDVYWRYPEPEQDQMPPSAFPFPSWTTSS